MELGSASDSSGKKLHYSPDGIANFWEWWDGTQGAKAELVEGSGASEDAGRVDSGFVRGQGFTDEAGRPLVFYHGTNADVQAFDPDHRGKWDSGWLGKAAVYLTNDSDLAAMYADMKAVSMLNSGRGVGAGQIVMPLYTRAKNPVWLTAKDKARIKQWGAKKVAAWTNARLAEGYDSAAVDWGDGGYEVAVFRAEDVKSASGNVGTFSGRDPRISFSEAATDNKAFAQAGSVHRRSVDQPERVDGQAEAGLYDDGPTRMGHEV